MWASSFATPQETEYYVRLGVSVRRGLQSLGNEKRIFRRCHLHPAAKCEPNRRLHLVHKALTKAKLYYPCCMEWASVLVIVRNIPFLEVWPIGFVRRSEKFYTNEFFSFAIHAAFHNNRRLPVTTRTLLYKRNLCRPKHILDGCPFSLSFRRRENLRPHLPVTPRATRSNRKACLKIIGNASELPVLVRTVVLISTSTPFP
jgi:hypothetical protein